MIIKLSGIVVVLVVVFVVVLMSIVIVIVVIVIIPRSYMRRQQSEVTCSRKHGQDGRWKTPMHILVGMEAIAS